MTEQRISVLLIEDSPAYAHLVQEDLMAASDPGYRVECVDRLSTGLARLAEGSIDVLLLDLGLPDSHGLEALAPIQAVAPAVPVVVLSAAADEQLAVEAVQMGAQDYLVKTHATRHVMTRSLRYAIERKRTDVALQAANHRLRQLSLDLLRSQDYERRRIARELHDGLAQLLAAIGFNLSRVRTLGLASSRQDQLLTEVLDQSDQCLQEVRTLSYLLHPPLLDEVGLTGALESYAEGFRERTMIQTELNIPRDFGRLSSEMELILFRIVQEGLANVHKHSGSPTALVHLERSPREVRLVLEDRGRRSPTKFKEHPRGFARLGVGILGMRERAEQLGGKLEISAADSGTKLIVTLPIVENHEEDKDPCSR